MQTSEKFLKALIKKAFPEMDASAINLMIEDATPVLQDRVFAKINNQLTVEQNAELADLMQTEDFDAKAVYSFLEKNIKNYPEFISKVHDNFEKKYLEEIKYFQENKTDK